MADFETIYTQYYESVYKYVFSLCRSEAVAEEITQETFYKAMEHLDQFDGRCRLYVWLCQIAKNTFYTYAGKRKRCVSEAEAELPEQDVRCFVEELLDREAAWEIHKLLHQLKEPYKEVFLLRVFGELPFSKIGELFGKTDSWARLVFYRARKELRRNLNESVL